MAGDPSNAQPAAHEVLSVGPWRIDRSLNQLRRGAESIRLEPKAMELLVYLAERPGQVISREALLQAVWPSVIVGDDALTQAVIKLRKALGDTPRAPVFIETVAKRGYRLIAAAQNVPVPVAETAASPSSAPERAPGANRHRGPLRRIALAVAAAAAAVALGFGALNLVMTDASNLPRDVLQLGEKPTVAVRPFDVLGDDPRASLFAAGLAADLGTDLAKVAGLTVLGGPRTIQPPGARSEAFAARYVVSGSVQRDADRLRVHVRLGDAQSGRQLWSERFERPIGDLFALQDDVVTRILEQLPVQIGEAERAQLARRYTRSIEAYELFQRGLLASGSRDREQNEAARTLYLRAIAIDPGFARAHAGIAMTLVQSYRQQWSLDGAASLASAVEMAQAAVRLDPESAEALWVLAFALMHRQEHAAAARLLEKAIRLSPSYADAYFLMGWIHTDQGQPQRGLELMHAALRLVPNPGYLHYYGLGMTYFFLGQYEIARTNLEQGLLQNPTHAELHVYLIAALAREARMQEANWYAEELRLLRPGFTVRRWLQGQSLAAQEQRMVLVGELEKFGF